MNGQYRIILVLVHAFFVNNQYRIGVVHVLFVNHQYRGIAKVIQALTTILKVDVAIGAELSKVRVPWSTMGSPVISNLETAKAVQVFVPPP